MIDLGTNSFHTLIVDIFPNGSYSVVDKLKEMVKLGEGGFDNQMLLEGAMERARAALHRVRLLAEGHGATDYLAFATSAIRESDNGGDLIRDVQEADGIRIRPIAGEREAQLIYLGVRRAVAMPDPALIVDIGGGSTEFVVGTAEQVYAARSLKVGAARMTESFITTDPVEKDEFKALRAHYRKVLRPVFDAVQVHGVKEIIGSSGTMENLAAVCAKEHGDSSRSIFQQAFTASDMRKVTKQLMRSTVEERRGMSGIDAKRVEQVVAGAILVDVLLKDSGIERIRVSPHALREGMVEHYIQEHLPRLKLGASFSSVRERSVHEIGNLFQWEYPHARHVATLALRLFDGCASLHGLGPWTRELLEYAGLLHDIGYHISHRRHHKHGLYLIQNADFRGFQPEEIQVMANLARYHRRAYPKSKHDHFTALSDDHQDLIWKVAPFLRIAEGLDRSHCQTVTDLRVDLSGDPVVLHLTTDGEPHRDVWGGRHCSAMFEEAYGRPVAMQVHEETA